MREVINTANAPGSPLYSQAVNAGQHVVDIYAATIPSFPFAPGVHVNYESTVLRMKDGLPKLNDFPAELGGSGEAVAE